MRHAAPSEANQVSRDSDVGARPSRLRGLKTAMTFALGVGLWLPCVRLLFPVDMSDAGRDELASSLLRAQLVTWQGSGSERIERMRRANGEWDFMARTFFVLALTNRAIDQAEEEEELLAIVDRILEETLRLEREHGQQHFLLPYASARPFRDESGRSLFVDGEIALMLAARQRVHPAEVWRKPLAMRIARVANQMSRGPIGSAESYPDECWTFCNSVALAALELDRQTGGADHREVVERWLAGAREHLIDPQTGLLVSSYTHAGRPLDGPEGSSIFLVAHLLQIVDPEFAADQYARARAELGRELFGFGWAREWPTSWEGPMDIDSGPIIPLVGASAGASGLAFVGAATFDDQRYLRSLYRSMRFAAFPEETDGALRFAASNSVGDAVLLYSLSAGPLFDFRSGPRTPPSPPAPLPEAKRGVAP